MSKQALMDTAIVVGKYIGLGILYLIRYTAALIMWIVLRIAVGSYLVINATRKQVKVLKDEPKPTAIPDTTEVSSPSEEPAS